jgi:hypothetical protein
MTIVVNLFAGSGVGKSTNAARLFAMLKELGIEAELVTEYVKDMVWEDRKKIFECQPYIFGKQLYKIMRINGRVDVIVTDSPILLSAVYDPEQDNDFERFVVTKFNQFNNLNFFLNRIHKFNPNGRNESTVEQAIANDWKIESFLLKHNVRYVRVDSNQSGCEIMLKEILNKLEEVK